MGTIGATPARRLRRLRRTPELRALVRENRVFPRQLVLPVFVADDEDDAGDVASMPGVRRHAVKDMRDVAAAAADAGIGGLLLFGITRRKDPTGSEASAQRGVVQRAVRSIRESGHTGVVATDVCLCEYTDHGHCGIVGDDGAILNDNSVARLAEVAVSHADSGADIVAPSAMMDGQVGAIRDALDAAGHHETAILSYSAKYASAFYGPFRDAAGGAPAFGDRRTHQMDPANGCEAIQEHEADVAEGADMLLVKPGLACLDVIQRSHDAFPHFPLAVYNVSGEYSMIKAAVERGWIEERLAVLEILSAFVRAGADVIITYHALDAARWLRDSPI